MTTAANPIFPPPATVHWSPWHSPRTYLISVLAAMLVLIVFALYILACSCRRQSHRPENGERNFEAGDGKLVDAGKAFPEFEEKYLVTMAGDVNPTFLASPVRSKACSLDRDSEVKREEMEIAFNHEKVKQDTGLDYQMVTTTDEGSESESENRTQENN